MEVLLIIILAIIALGYLFRLLTPWLLKMAIKRMQKRYGYTQSTQQQQKEGEVSVQSTAETKKPKKKITKDVGDYVDFEEVK